MIEYNDEETRHLPYPSITNNNIIFPRKHLNFPMIIFFMKSSCLLSCLVHIPNAAVMMMKTINGHTFHTWLQTNFYPIFDKDRALEWPINQ